MLHEFLADRRGAILTAIREKTFAISESKPSSARLEQGLPEFYDRLVVVLKERAAGKGKAAAGRPAPATARHGRESLRLGYTVSQVVHGYGVICQAITELAQKEGATITPAEFGTLNLSLDVAIAEAVTGYESRHIGTPGAVERIGALVHELRNALTCAMVAHSMVAKGLVGVGGGTNAMLERNLRRMRDLLDRSFTEVRFHKDPEPDLLRVCLLDAFEEVELTTSEAGEAKGMRLAFLAPADLHVRADRNYLISALSNLVQNAVKFSGRGTAVSVRAVPEGALVRLEVEDSCGGLPPGKAEELFKPFVQKGVDRSGLGLGLSISRRAVALNGGELSVRDLPGTGCVFSFSLPTAEAA